MKKLLLLLLLPFSIVSQLSIDQKKEVDSLQNIVKTAKHDTVLINALLAWDNIIYAVDPKLDFELTYKIDSICDINLVQKLDNNEKLFYLKSKGMALNNFGLIYFDKGENNIALEYYVKSLKICEEVGAKERVAILLNNLAVIYRIQGDFRKSIEISMKSLKISEEIKDQMGVASSLSNIAVIYKQQEEYSKALEYNKKSLIVLQELDYQHGIALCLNNIGNIYHEQDSLSKALDFHNQSLSIRREMGSQRGIATSLANIGSVYYDQELYDEALDFHTRSLEIQKELNDKSEIAASLNSIGSVYYKKGSLIKALDYGNKSFEIAKENGDKNRVKLVTELLWKVNKNLNKPLKSLEMYELHILTRDSIFSQANQKAIIEQEYKYEYEKQATADSVKLAENNKVRDALFLAEKADSKRLQTISIAVTGGLGLVAVFLIFVYRRLQITRKQNILIESKKKELENQKEELILTYDKLAETSKELHDSIAYAELIQQAVLPTLKIEDLTKESFIYFNPKEKVSGDFYWIEQKDEYHGYAVADCTGHGIPGAFISMVGTILLNEIYNSKQIHVPNEILDELSRLVRLTLTNKEGYTMKDGMDISFAVLDNNTKMLYFSGANNPVWIVSKNPHKRINKTTAIPLSDSEELYLYEIKGDRQPVGEYGDRAKPFTLNSAHLEEGDAFYLFSDGFVDQFGGEKGKKFKARPFREYLLLIYNQSMEEQEISLSSRFESWRGELEQIDDVTIMGVRV